MESEALGRPTGFFFFRFAFFRFARRRRETRSTPGSRSRSRDFRTWPRSTTRGPPSLGGGGERARPRVVPLAAADAALPAATRTTRGVRRVGAFGFSFRFRLLLSLRRGGPFRLPPRSPSLVVLLDGRAPPLELRGVGEPERGEARHLPCQAFEQRVLLPRRLRRRLRRVGPGCRGGGFGNLGRPLPRFGFGRRRNTGAGVGGRTEAVSASLFTSSMSRRALNSSSRALCPSWLDARSAVDELTLPSRCHHDCCDSPVATARLRAVPDAFQRTPRFGRGPTASLHQHGDGPTSAPSRLQE